MSVQIWTDSDYVYAVTSSGLEVYDIATELLGATAYNIDGYSSVWSGGDYIYIGTFGAGLKKLYKPSIIMNVYTPTNLNSYVSSYFSYPDIRSNDIKYIHGNYNKLIVCSASGVDIVRTDSLYITSRTISSGETPLKCFATETDDFYYMTISGSTYYLHYLNRNKSDWLNSDYFYTTNNGIFSGVNLLTDMYITSGTSVSGSSFNTLFVTTNSGVYVIDEGSGNYVIFTII